MRHFTRTHNDLKWLFPIAKTKAEANEVFSYVEENAKNLVDSAGITDNDIDYPIRNLRIYHLNGTLIKRIPQTGESIKSVLSGLPKGFYIVKEATKTYKVYNGE